MRDPEVLISLLRGMSEDESGMGRAMVPLVMGGEGDGFVRHHHDELLVDAGHAEWTGYDQQIVRITNDGYDFLGAVDNQAKAKTGFLEMFNKGAPYVRGGTESHRDRRTTGRLVMGCPPGPFRAGADGDYLDQEENEWDYDTAT